MDALYVALTVGFFAVSLGLLWLCESLMGERIMNPLYLIAGVISLLLFVYLIIALLRPELF